MQIGARLRKTDDQRSSSFDMALPRRGAETGRCLHKLQPQRAKPRAIFARVSRAVVS